nr:CDP-glucose 4,6-dehydratase [uncultured Aminipila sp.]
MELSDLKNKKVFITGHTGFKGTWLVLLLEELGAVVRGYSLGVDKNSLFELVKPKTESNVFGDIQDFSLLEKSIQEFKPDYIIHLAAQAYVDKSIIDPIGTFNTNIIGLANILKIACDIEELKSILVVTSDKCYKNTEKGIPYVESDELGAQDPYSTSKACQELIAESYRFSYFGKKGIPVPISTARASNVIGGGDFILSRLVPYLLDSFANNQIPVIRNPYAVRPWQYVLDVLTGYLKLLLAMEKEYSLAGAYNFGPEKDGIRDVRDLSIAMAKYFGNSTFNITENKLSSYETKILMLDSSKAKEKLKWKPIYNFDKTIETISLFTQRYYQNENIKTLCKEQIDAYFRNMGY